VSESHFRADYNSNLTLKLLKHIIMECLTKTFASLLLLLLPLAILAQEKRITGTVIDDGGAMRGVTVQVKNSTAATQTDSLGRFTIQAPEGSTLVFSSSGYTAQEAPVGENNNLTITLVRDPNSLESVVVVGYGTRQRQHLSGSVATVGGEVTEARPITNTLSALQGAVPGVIIERSSGQPGREGYKLNVRGFSSASSGGNEPMVLIDGVPGSLELLNPNDILSITVLRDAAAAIYGARAAGGVVLVTTKKGKKGRPSFNFGSNAAVSKLDGMMETPTNYEFAIMDNEANIHAGASPMYTEDYLQRILNNDPNPIPHPLYGGWLLFFTNTDWRDALFTNGFQQQHHVNISGGGDNSTYYLSGSYLDQKGVIRDANDNNKRYNLRLNYDYDFSKRIRLETKIAFEDQVRSDVGGVSDWIITEGIFGMPNHPVYTQSGTKYFAQGGWGNAVAMAKEAETSTYKTRNINTNFKLIAEVARGLKVNLQAGINHSNGNNTEIAKGHPLYTWDESSIAYYSIAAPEQNSMTKSSMERTYRNLTGYVQYNTIVNGRHNIDIMAGASHEENQYEFYSAFRDHFTTDDVWNIGLGGNENMQIDGEANQWSLRSVFSRLGYILDNKYIFEANLRYDGSSRFAKGHRWGLFSGFSAAWRLSEESFIKDLNIFDDLKLRASYGETGNQDVVELYDYLQLISIGRPWPYYPYPFGPGLPTPSAYSDIIASVDRSWETVVNRNIGIDLAVFKARLSFSFDLYNKTNRNMLAPIQYPAILGATPPFLNAGELKTSGFETSVSWRDHVGEFDYSAKFILSDSKNELVSYGGEDVVAPGLNPRREGYPLNSYFAYVFDGLLRTEKELEDYRLLAGVPGGDLGLGDARFKDINGDGAIDPANDLVHVGTTLPRFLYGLNLGASFKNFDLSIFIQGVGKRAFFRTGEYSMPWSDWWRQPPSFYYGKTWNEDRPDAEYPRLTHGNSRYWNYQPSTLQKINAAYARLKNVQIGYSLPSKVLGRIGLERTRIYVSGENIAEVHNVKGGWDPESSENGFNYPFQRFYSAGIDITF
jgi:TonB-linked SusC/RagA family outer membrane protein